MCIYQNRIYFCKTTFGTLIGGNVLTSHGINKACRKKADIARSFFPLLTPQLNGCL